MESYDESNIITQWKYFLKRNAHTELARLSAGFQITACLK